MRKHTGFNIPGFPATYYSPKKSGSGNGVKCIEMKEGQDETHCSLWLEYVKCSNLNSIPELPCLYYGDFRDDAILVQFRDGMQYGWNVGIAWLQIWFFENMKGQAATLYNRWISGEMILKDEIDEYVLNTIIKRGLFRRCNKLHVPPPSGGKPSGYRNDRQYMLEDT
jgi:hypothetical protein